MGLQMEGLGRREIARRSGVSPSIVARLLGLDKSKPARRVTPATQEALLRVQPDTLADHALVPILGSQRRLQALVALGWTQSYLAKRLDWSAGNLNGVIKGRRLFVLQQTASQIRALYEELQDTRGPSVRAVHHALAHGWPPPAAWEDIDDLREEREAKEAILTTCGWCITGAHDQCKPEGSYYDKTWTCECADRKHKEKP
jgi:transcriptional regulator with XRE-family HTH domain